MAISIDTVYQRVLALANKEQRGYITPQEFNLFANQAQQEIFEQYFYDTNQFARVPGNDTVYADVDDMLEEKMQIFQEQQTVNSNIPNIVYRVYRIELNNINCEILRTKDFNNAFQGGPLTIPSITRPIANNRNNILRVSSGNTVTNIALVFYFRKPIDVEWGYFVINDKALYDPNPSKTTNFELHASEESELVYRILAYAGITLQKPQLTQIAAGLEEAKTQQEKQ